MYHHRRHRSPPAPPPGSAGNPYAANTAESFADIMRDLAIANQTIRLGPGVFYTRGASGNGFDVAAAQIWNPRPGQRLIGAERGKAGWRDLQVIAAAGDVLT